MSDSPIVVNLFEWVERAKSDPSKYLERQATEVLLAAIGQASNLSEKIFLKGGTLMGVVYQSPRQTADVDFSTTLDPTKESVEMIDNTLNTELPRAAANLGYTDLICKVQKISLQPRKEVFEHAKAPALKLNIGYAVRNSPEEMRLNNRQSTLVLKLDISFLEPIDEIQIIKLDDSQLTIKAYSLVEMIAEKLRAYLQQEKRNRSRRQDIYDLSLLIKTFELDDHEKSRILNSLKEKCAARNITPTIDSISQPELAARAQAEWSSMSLELEVLPKFEECFEIVESFYKSLPW